MENLDISTRTLQRLDFHDVVQIQNQVGSKPTKWNATDVIVEVKSHDQYLVKIHDSGRLTLRNRKFLKKIQLYGDSVNPRVDMCDLSNSGTNPIQTSSQEMDINGDQPEVAIDDTTNCEDFLETPLQTDLKNPTVSNPEPIVEANEPQSSSVPELRVSTRTREEPKRLNINSWKGSLYEANGVTINQIGHQATVPF